MISRRGASLGRGRHVDGQLVAEEPPTHHGLLAMLFHPCVASSLRGFFACFQPLAESESLPHGRGSVCGLGLACKRGAVTLTAALIIMGSPGCEREASPQHPSNAATTTPATTTQVADVQSSTLPRDATDSNAGSNAAPASAVARAAAGGDSGRVDPAAQPADSPRAVMEALIALRARREYARMERWILTGQAAPVINFLLALDELMAANERLQLYIRREIGPALAQHVDQSALARHVEIFSPHVRLLDETRTGDAATVSFTVDGRLPAREARAVRLPNGEWRYDPGTGYSAALPAAFRRMAVGMDQAIADFRTGRLTAEEVRARPALLIQFVADHLREGIQMLPVVEEPISSDKP